MPSIRRVYLVVCVLFLGSMVRLTAAASGPKTLFSTYFGGSGFDQASRVATDSAGNIYITGTTSSPSLPGNSTPPLGLDDMFVAKLGPSGQLLYSIRLGGSQSENPQGIAVDQFGNAYVTGLTASADFPIVNGFQAHFGGGFFDAFILKLDPSGNLVYSSFLGGSGSNEDGAGIAVDNSGNAYVVGITDSPDFPTVNAIQSNNAGSADAFIAKINTNVVGAASLVYSTYLGGAGFDSGNAVAVDSSGNAYVTGFAGCCFPTTAGAFQTFIGNSSWHVFVTKVGPSGSLLYSTLLGGSNYDFGYGIAVDNSGIIYLAGETSSLDFPVTPQSFQSQNNSLPQGLATTAFFAKLNPAISGAGELVYSTYLGGTGSDSAYGVAVDSSSHAYLTGSTTSADFPTQNTIQPGMAGNRDAFLVELDPTVPGTQALLFGTYLGGTGQDSSLGLALASDARVAIAGYTESGDFPVVQAFQPLYAGSRDAFVAYVAFDTVPPTLSLPSDAVINATSPAGAAFTFTASATDDQDSHPVISCLPPSGTTFAIGTTLDTCTASDASGNTATASFKVSVQGAAQQISNLQAYVASLNLPGGLTNGLESKLRAAAQDAVPGSCGDLRDFATQVSAQTGKTISGPQSAIMLTSASRIEAVLGCR